MKQLSTWTLEDLLKTLALFGAGMAFVIGLFQYRRSQQWKRAEWVAQEMKNLFGEPIVQAALLMIDWGSRRVPLYPEREEEAKRYVFLTDDDIARALMRHEDRPEGFTDLEADIRSAFDRFLDGLERFDSYVTTRLVRESDLAPYLSYWAREICTEAKSGSEDRLIQLRDYMDKYGFRGAQRLLRRIARPRWRQKVAATYLALLRAFSIPSPTDKRT